MIRPLDKTKWLPPPFGSSHENCPGHVYFPLTRSNSRLLRAVMRSYTRCLVGPL